MNEGDRLAPTGAGPKRFSIQTRTNLVVTSSYRRMKGERLGEFEEFTLLAVRALGDHTYAVPIQQYVEKVTARPISIGSIYAALARLEEKGFLRSTMSRGGGATRRQVETGLHGDAERAADGARPAPRTRADLERDCRRRALVKRQPRLPGPRAVAAAADARAAREAGRGAGRPARALPGTPTRSRRRPRALAPLSRCGESVAPIAAGGAYGHASIHACAPARRARRPQVCGAPVRATASDPPADDRRSFTGAGHCHGGVQHHECRPARRGRRRPGPRPRCAEDDRSLGVDCLDVRRVPAACANGSTRMQVEAVLTDAALVRTTAAETHAPSAGVAFVSGGFFAATGGRMTLGRPLSRDR